MNWRRARCLFALCAAAQDATAQRAVANDAATVRLTPAQLRAYGRQAMAREIAEYGQLDDANVSSRVASILRRLINATAHPEFSIEFAVVRDSSVNASMLPGAVMVVNEGLLLQIAEWALAEAPTEAAQRDRRSDAYLAAVLAHELAHATLGHSDSALVAAVRDEVKRQFRAPGVEDVEGKVRALLSDARFMSERRIGRGHELEADRLGALYMLRAGWEIQDAMSLMRWLDGMERSTNSASLSQLSWFADHPRSSTREAGLEVFRASLKAHQAEFDDALLLLRSNIMLDSATALLDRVLMDFPDLIAALHARASVLHRQWMNAMPVQLLQVRSSVPTYDARFISGIRGTPASPTLAAARLAYGRVLTRETQPFTLSNLAVLDAYAGAMPLALARSDSAVRMAKNDPMVLNNRACILYLAQRYGDARDIYRSLARANRSSSAQFNYGRSQLAMGDSAGARGTLRDYLMSDGESAWAREADRLLQALDAARVLPRTGPKGGPLPLVGGVQLGAHTSQVRGALGAPETIRRGGVVTLWRYPSRGVVVGFAVDSVVSLVGLSVQTARDVDGVRVGDTEAMVRERWRAPLEYTDRLLIFDRGGWLAMVALDQGVVVELAAERRK